VYDEIVDAVKTLAKAYAAPPYTTIPPGSLPQANGLAMYIGAGAPDEEYLDRGSTNIIDIVLNGKHSTEKTVLSALSNIHKNLSQLRTYPSGGGWEITNIRTGTAPNYIDREASSGQWLYGSILEVQFYVKGV
jgi:hypothetical protein